MQVMSPNNFNLYVPQTREDFYLMIDSTLSQEDIEEFLESLNNEEIYHQADEEIQDLVDAYYKLRI